MRRRRVLVRRLVYEEPIQKSDIVTEDDEQTPWFCKVCKHRGFSKEPVVRAVVQIDPEEPWEGEEALYDYPSLMRHYHRKKGISKPRILWISRRRCK